MKALIMKNVAKKIKVHHIIISALLLVGLGARLYYVGQINDVGGGDAYNFLLISKALLGFKSPFIEKRLPFYPLLLVPGLVTPIDPILWGRLVNIFAAIGSALLLYLIGKRLGVERYILYVAVTILLFNKVFWSDSLRPLAHTPLTFMILLSTYLFFHLDTPSQQALFGIVLGATAMTRHEGFLLVPVFFLALLFKRQGWKAKLKELSFVFLPFAIIVAPFFLSNILCLGNPFYSEYFQDPGLNRVSDIETLIRNTKATGMFFVSLWGDFFSESWGQKTIAFLALVFSTVGLVEYLRVASAKRIVVLLIMLLQALVGLWVQPRGRYFQQVIPLLALLLSIGFFAAFNSELRSNIPSLRQPSRGFLFSCFILFVLYIALSSNTYVKERIRVANIDSAKSFVLTQAIKYAGNLRGRIGFEADFLPARIYVGDERAAYFENEVQGDRDEAAQLQWMKERDLDYVVWYSEKNLLTVVKNKDHQAEMVLVCEFSLHQGEKFISAEIYKLELTTNRG